MEQKKSKRLLKKIFIGIVVLLLAIQFVRPDKNNNTAAAAEDITTLYPIPDSVHKVLQKACYDCHSNNTTYPWYFSFQPVAWWMNDHIKEGKEELNFSEFGKRPPAKQARKLKKLAKEVEEGEMPLNSYTWIHKEAVLTDQEKKMVINWANDLSQQISANLPAGK